MFSMFRFRLCISGYEYYRSDVVSFSLHPGGTENFICPINGDNFYQLVKMWLPRFSIIKLLFFLLLLISIFGKMLWDYVSVLFLIKFLPTSFSIHVWYMIKTAITVVVAEWWFSNSHHYFCIYYLAYYCKEVFSLLPLSIMYLSIYQLSTYQE